MAPGIMAIGMETAKASARAAEMRGNEIISRSPGKRLPVAYDRAFLEKHHAPKYPGLVLRGRAFARPSRRTGGTVRARSPPSRRVATQRSSGWGNQHSESRALIPPGVGSQAAGPPPTAPAWPT